MSPENTLDQVLTLLDERLLGLDEQKKQLKEMVRMVTSVKEAIHIENQIRTAAEQSFGQTDWLRFNANTAPAAQNIPAIGTERKKATRGTTDNYSAWLTGNNLPDLPSPPLTIPDIVSNSELAGIGTSGLLTNTANLYNAGYQGSWQSTAASNAQTTHSGMNLANYAYAMRHQLAMAIVEQASKGGTATGASAATALLLQQTAKLRGAAIQNQQEASYTSQAITQNTLSSSRGSMDDSSSLNKTLTSLNIGNPNPFEARLPGSRQLSHDQNEGRLTELKIHSVFGTSQPGSTIRELHCPSGFCLSEMDDILIADTNNHRVTVCGPPAPWKIGKAGTEDGMLCFPRKVVALKGEIVRYVVLDKGADGKTRAQIFDNRGEFLKRINLAPIVPRGGIEVAAATCTSLGYLVLVDTCSTVFVIDVDAPRVVNWFDASSHLGEASDVAVYEKYIYITDFKHHCVQVFSLEGMFIRKLGEPSQTPYPIGIDVSKNGDILVADTHGNHLHVVVFSTDGSLIQSFTHNEFRLSRCVGLRVAGSGHIVTLCKHNHTLFVFKPLYIR